MAQDYEASLTCFVEVVDRFPNLSEFENDPKLVALYRKVCYAVNWLEKTARGGTELIKPQTAWFTDESVPQGKDVKLINSHPYVWYLLASLEYQSNLGDAVFRRFEEVSRTACLPLIQCSLEELRIKRSLRRVDLEYLMDQYAEFSRMIKALAERRGGTETTQSNSKSVIDLILTALVKVLISGNHRIAPCAAWKAAAARHGFLDEPVSSILDFVEMGFNMDEGGLIKVVKNLRASWSARVAASVLLSASEGVDPEDRFLANVFLVQAANGFGPWRDEAEGGVEHFVTHGWATTIEQQRASLLSPRTTVPIISSACSDDSCHGLKKAARVVVAAKAAVRVRVADELMMQLTEISAY